MRKLSLAIRTVFSDLHQKVETSQRGGSVYARTRDGIEYLYAKVQVGTARLDRFLGRRGDPDAEARAKAYTNGIAQASERRRTASLLRKAGLSGPDHKVGATLDSLQEAGLFAKGAVVIGTGAYLLSEALVGQLLPSPTLMTEDLDVATPDLTISADDDETILPILRRGDPSFEGVMQLDARKPSSRFKTAGGFLVDLVTPVLRRTDENPMALRQLQAGAAPLPYLRWLIENPVPTVALWGPGILVNVPQPTRYAVHKLILAQKRFSGAASKRSKDLAQAAALIAALEQEDPFRLEDAFADARARGQRGWADPIARSLKEIGRTDLLD